MGTQTLEAKVIGQTVKDLLFYKAQHATYFGSKNFIVRATRKLYKGKMLPGNIEVSLTIGRPNYKEREFIKRHDPVGATYFKYPPNKKK